MPFGRLIRLRKQGDSHGIAYIVAITNSTEAVALIRWKVGGAGDEIEDLGRVSDELLKALNLTSGEFARADEPHRSFGSDE